MTGNDSSRRQGRSSAGQRHASAETQRLAAAGGMGRAGAHVGAHQFGREKGLETALDTHVADGIKIVAGPETVGVVNHFEVDAATARMVNRPASLDTLVATNLHADILSDLAAALAGSLGIAPTGNIDPERRYPSMFEPIHGSAFDIMGKGLANPVGTFWSVVMLLEHIGEHDAAKRLMQAVEAVTANPALHTGDLGGNARTVRAPHHPQRRCTRRSVSNLRPPPWQRRGNTRHTA